MLDRLKKFGLIWGPIVILGTVVIAAVYFAYQLTENPSPLDAVRTAGTLLLTVYLLHIYRKQNQILERHEEVFEDQFEAQEAVEVEPNLYVKELGISFGNLQLTVENTGGGDAHNISLITDLDLPEDITDEIGSSWETNLTYHLKSGFGSTFNKELKFALVDEEEETGHKALLTKIGLTLPGSYKSEDKSSKVYNFEQLTKKLMSATDVSSLTLEISLTIRFYDSRGKEYLENLITDSVEIRRIESLSADHAETWRTRSLKPNLDIEDWDLLSDSGLTGTDKYGFEVKNTGDVPAYVESISTSLWVWNDGSLVPSEDFFESSGEDRPIAGYTHELDEPVVVRPGSDELVVDSIRFTVDGSGDCSFYRLTERMLEEGIENPISIRFSIDYVDDTGVSGSLERRLTGFVCSDGFFDDVSPDEYARVSEPCNLENL